MRRICNVFALGMVMCVVLARDLTLGSPASGQDPPPQARPSVATPPNSQQNQEANERLLKQLSDRIKGRENDPAEQVFENIQIPWLKTVPAGVFFCILNGGVKER